MKRDDLEEWSALESQRRTLQSELGTVRQRQQQLEERFEAELVASGKSQLKRHGYILAIVPGRATVSWSTEYLKACGQEAAQALKNEAVATAKSVFVITPPE